MEKNILSEEIVRIKEIMGIKSKNQLVEAANPMPVVYDLVGDFLKKMTLNGGEEAITKGYKLIDDFERAGQNGPKLRNSWSTEEKELYNNMSKLKTNAGINKDELIDLLQGVSSKNPNIERKLYQLEETLFKTPGFIEMAEESFFRVNKEAESWKTFLNVDDWSKFKSEEQIRDWATDKRTIIDDADLPDYIKSHFIEQIDKSEDSLIKGMSSWSKNLESNDYYQRLQNLNSKVNKNEFNKVARKIYYDKSKSGKLNEFYDELDVFVKISNTGIQNLTKEEFEIVYQWIKKNMTDVSELTATIEKYKEKLPENLRQNPTWLSRTCMDVWKTMSQSEKDNKILQVLKYLRVQQISRIKYTKCLILPIVGITVIIYMFTGISLFRQLSFISVKTGVYGYLTGDRTNEDTIEKFKELFPNLSNLVGEEQVVREILKSIAKKVLNTDDTEETKEEVKNLVAIKLYLNDLGYYVVCTDTSSDNEFNDENNWVIANPNDKTITSIPTIKDSFTSQNKLSEILNNDNKLIGGNKFNIVDWRIVKNESTNNEFDVYYVKNKDSVYSFIEDSPGNFKPVDPTTEDFFNWITSDSGTPEGWGPSKKGSLYVDGETPDSGEEYRIYKDKKLYIIQDTKQPDYKEKYTFDRVNKTFKYQ
jgi:hypothetical protein